MDFVVILHYLTNQFFSEFTGVSAPYEAPENAELHIKTDESDVTDSVRIITDYLSRNDFI